jgi:peptide/nickel transport system substrate-binding protein
MNSYLSSGRMHEWYPNQEKPATEAEAKIDELMYKYVKSPTYEEQKKHFFEVQRIMAEEQFTIYTVSANIYAAVRNKYGNPKPAILRPRFLWNAEELFVKFTP